MTGCPYGLVVKISPIPLQKSTETMSLSKLSPYVPLNVNVYCMSPSLSLPTFLLVFRQCYPHVSSNGNRLQYTICSNLKDVMIF